MLSFRLEALDPNCRARRGRIQTAHGEVETPTFMPVGTVGTVKGLTIDQVGQTGAGFILGNTYHLALRPGADLVAQLGGLHKFTGWDGPILTDSGGFQIFSLAKLTKITEERATFQSHIDGRKLEMSPEDSVQIQAKLGSDVAMVLDHVVGLPNPSEVIREACERSIRWAKRSQDAHAELATRIAPHQVQFAIVQGGLDPEMRRWCAEELAALDFPGYAIGGLSVGEPPEDMYRMLEVTCPALPSDRPRYLMGVGRPEDLVEGVFHGVDMFDCVMPTRNGRNALAFTDSGPLRMRNEQYREDDRPLEPSCPCVACQRSRAYIRHLFMAREMLGPILLSIHNLTYYQRLMREAREAISAGTFREFRAGKISGWAGQD